MWNGSRSGPGGGMPFRGDPRGEMFEGKNGPMPGFRGREGMSMGAGSHDRPPMDIRRFDCPPNMMGRNMGLERGRERDFFRSGNELNMNFRRHFGMEQNAGDFMGQGRPPMGMGGRDMQGRNMRGPEDQSMDMRERDRFRGDLPGFNMSPMDVRRRMAMEPMNRNDNLKMSQMGINDIDGFSMNMPPQDRTNMDFERRRGPPPLNPRERFESDMDFRNRMGSPGDFRDRPPQMLRDSDGTPINVRGRPDGTANRQGPEKPSLKLGESTLRDREFPEQMDNPAGFRGEGGKSPSEDWCRRDTGVRESLSPMMNRSSSLPREMKDRFLPGKEGELGDPSQFKEREWKTMEFKDRDTLGFSRPDRKGPAVQKWDTVPSNFPIGDAQHGVQKPQLLPLDPTLNNLSRNSDGKPWAREDKANLFSVDQAAVKAKDMLFNEGQKKGNLMPGPREPQSNKGGRQDQDYRDIDYRTSSGQKFDYVLENLQDHEKNLKEPKVALLERPNSSGSQDQDYRSAGVQDQISSTIAVSEIPKTATMQQILDAFAVRDGVPMQGMKIRNVVPGYSSDTAYVEFLNLEDAVHFMESNQGSVKVGSKTALLKYVQPGGSENEQQRQDPPPKATPSTREGLLPLPVMPSPTGVKEEGCAKPLNDPPSQSGWQRSSNLTPEAWQQQVDKQLQQQETQNWADELVNQKGGRTTQPHTDPVLNESKTMIIKNLLPTTTLETILKALDPFAYLDERNVRLVKGKTPGSKCFCFVDMDSHEQVVRLVELLTKPRPIMVDRVRVFAEVAKPLKNQNYRKDHEKSNTSLLGLPPDVMEQQYYQQPSHTAVGISAAMQGMCASTDLKHSTGTDSSMASATLQNPSLTKAVTYSDVPAVEPSTETTPHQGTTLPDPGNASSVNSSEVYNYDTDTPDLTAFLYDATSGFYYDPQTTLYYDPNSRYFYNAQTQQYLYWDSTSKAYVPVDGSSTNAQELSAPPGAVAEAVAVEEQKAPPEGAADQRDDEEAMARSEKKDKEKEDKPKSLAAFKIMKDMERWAKIQNRQKDTVRSPSPVLKGLADDKKASKAADAAFAVFERKNTGGDDLFKKPLAPVKKEEKVPKRPMGSLGMLAADYGAGSDDEEEDKHEKNEVALPVAKSQPQSEEREDRLTDWKKMACLLCRRQFPSKDALVRHQQLSDLHKQNMEIHLKIKKSKKELEALETQEKEMKMREANSPPDAKRRKQDTWGSSSRDAHKGNERPGLGMDSTERKKKESATWNYASYKQAVRKAMFARFKELD